MSLSRIALGLVLGAAGVGAGGCDDDGGTSAPAAPSATRRDAGPRGDASIRRPPIRPPIEPRDEDGGVFAPDSGVLATECQEITPVPFIGEDTADGQYANAVVTPSDLLASRIVGTWSGRCDPAEIVIEMSDGDCPYGDGHGLLFMLDAGAIADGSLGLGIHGFPDDAKPPAFDVRYVRPERLPPAGEWGLCPGASGTLNVREIGDDALDVLQAQFELELAPCDDSGLPSQTILGTFNVRLRRGVDDVCPPG